MTCQGSLIGLGASIGLGMYVLARMPTIKRGERSGTFPGVKLLKQKRMSVGSSTSDCSFHESKLPQYLPNLVCGLFAAKQLRCRCSHLPGAVSGITHLRMRFILLCSLLQRYLTHACQCDKHDGVHSTSALVCLGDVPQGAPVARGSCDIWS